MEEETSPSQTDMWEEEMDDALLGNMSFEADEGADSEEQEV